MYDAITLKEEEKFSYKEFYEDLENYEIGGGISGYSISSDGSSISTDRYPTEIKSRWIEKNRTKDGCVTVSIKIKAVKQGTGKIVSDLESTSFYESQQYNDAINYQKDPNGTVKKLFPLSRGKSVLFHSFYMLEMLLTLALLFILPGFWRNKELLDWQLEFYLINYFQRDPILLSDYMPFDVNILLYVLAGAITALHITIKILSSVWGYKREYKSARRFIYFPALVTVLTSVLLCWKLSLPFESKVLDIVLSVPLNAKLIVYLLFPYNFIKCLIAFFHDRNYLLEKQNADNFRNRTVVFIKDGKIEQFEDRKKKICSYTVR